MLKPVVRGSGRVRAQVAKFERPISLLGDLDPESGSILGVDVVGKVVHVPHVVGSTVGPYVLWRAVKVGKAPAAFVARKPDLMLITACVLAGVPLFEGNIDTNCVEIDLGSGEYVSCG